MGEIPREDEKTATETPSDKAREAARRQGAYIAPSRPTQPGEPGSTESLYRLNLEKYKQRPMTPGEAQISEMMFGKRAEDSGEVEDTSKQS